MTRCGFIASDPQQQQTARQHFELYTQVALRAVQESNVNALHHARVGMMSVLRHIPGPLQPSQQQWRRSISDSHWMSDGHHMHVLQECASIEHEHRPGGSAGLVAAKRQALRDYLLNVLPRPLVPLERQALRRAGVVW
jgi:hypothetical protein